MRANGFLAAAAAPPAFPPPAPCPGSRLAQQARAISEVPIESDELRARCLSLPQALEDFPFGDEVSVFKVGGKMFAACRLDQRPLQLSVKCDPDLAMRLRADHPAITAGYHMNKRHWNTITIDGSLDDQMVVDLLEDSYHLVVASLPKARRPASGRD